MPKKSEKKSASKKEKKPKIESKKLSQEEYEKKVLELANSGFTSEKIGEKLRHENIHPKDHKVKISRILRKNNKYIQPDIKNLSEKVEKLKLHTEKNKQDKRSQREVVRISAQLKKLKQYHKII